MLIDDDLLNKLEKLSALKIPENERIQMKSQLTKIIDFVKILDEVDSKNLEIKKQNFTPLREDLPHQDQEVVDMILKSAPASEDHFFVVPKIIE
ncbi:glutamyl-tRNA(Gln) amidotransferase subunit C [Campylobacter ureolyticus]|uniref:Asp-tRNA(Asn)/Glu-tRNA(Gln) amidotransferase subunit GatC n=1 Tax=Campylobacter ureolyticus TaxID=827 RepID=UPI001FC7C614|nr:Asp-tRNA(Asn)/Glu-tRNA(Gln) amidotransferase subunit GatC [Campylobacter ureolyticus]GKH61144.1 glutamyl-tRNA(Gln) amidotransferase subunit C [Campylobacter ureolyticus]